MRTLRAVPLIALLLPALLAQPRQLRPGFNLFSKDQDIQLGKEAAAEIEKQSEVITNRDLNDYINTIGKKLAARPEADKYPYSFKVVNDKSINAFALPGGPTFVHTGLIAAADNEAQLAGVLAHEISHVALRHGTNQATRANFIQIGAMLAGKAVGSGSLLGQLGQLGIGLGANSVFLKFSRGAETEADLLGARMMAGAGYDPVEMARFFEKLKKGEGGGQRMPQFFSSHPDPGNRMKAIQQDISYLPKRSYSTGDSGQLNRAKSVVAKLPAPKKLRSDESQPQSATLSIPESRPSGKMLEYKGKEFQLAYPDNWKVFESQNSSGVTIAPPSGIQQSQEGVNIGYGLMVSTYTPQAQGADLRKATEELVGRMRSGDPNMKVVEASRGATLAGQQALVTMLSSQSIFQGQVESDHLVTVARQGGILYLVLIAPQSEMQHASPAWDKILQSLKFSR